VSARIRREEASAAPKMPSVLPPPAEKSLVEPPPASTPASVLEMPSSYPPPVSLSARQGSFLKTNSARKPHSARLPAAPPMVALVTQEALTKVLLNEEDEDDDEDHVSRTQGKDKTMVLNDITNSGVMSALVGGFALSSVQSGTFYHEESMMDNVAYVLLILAVHACTCSALTSALLYRTVNMMSEEEVPAWSLSNWLLLIMPMAKFGMGVLSYIVSVILISWRKLEDVPMTQLMACTIGVVSMSTVVMTVVMLNSKGTAAAKPPTRGEYNC